MATRVSSKLSLEGPFFRFDPRKTFLQNRRTMLNALAREGEEDVRQMLQGGQGNRRPVRDARPNRVAANVLGRTEALTGKDWRATAVVSVNNSRQSAKGGLQLMAAASNLEGRYHVFRKMTTRMRRSRKLNVAELLKGLQ